MGVEIILYVEDTAKARRWAQKEEWYGDNRFRHRDLFYALRDALEERGEPVTGEHRFLDPHDLNIKIFRFLDDSYGNPIRCLGPKEVAAAGKRSGLTDGVFKTIGRLPEATKVAVVFE